MSAHQLRHLGQPEVLKTVSTENLLALLKPHGEFFARHGMALPDSPDGFEPDYDRLARLFFAPEQAIPMELATALYFVDQMATNDCVDALVTAIPEIDDRCFFTAADIAVQGWLLNQLAFEQVCAEQSVRKRSRSFESYYAANRPLPTCDCSPETVDALEDELDRQFILRGRGDGTRLFLSERPDGFWFLIRHGERLRREGCIQNGKSGSVFFRPERYDAVVYDPTAGELRINAKTNWVKALYHRMFGKHLFGREDFFPGDYKYTLVPLLVDGEAALCCSDIPGIAWIRLVMIRYRWLSRHCLFESLEADNLFAAARDGECRMPQNAEIVCAQFQVQFTRVRTGPRAVTLRLPNVLKYTLDIDAACIEEWLLKRSFVLTQGNTSDVEHEAEPILAIA